MRAILLATMIACTGTATPSVPWLYGLTDAVGSENGSFATMQRLPDDSDVGAACGADAYRGIELVADVAPAPGKETIVAAYARGVYVYDATDHLLAATTGYYCVGYSDEITAIAAGDAYGERLIVVVGTSGGRRERETWLGLFRIVDRRLAPAFTARVERWRDDVVTRGAVILVPGGLVHRTPEGTSRLYFFDGDSGFYLLPGERIDRTDGDGPTIATHTN